MQSNCEETRIKFRTLRQITIDSLLERIEFFSTILWEMKLPPRRNLLKENAVYANIDA
jgi:hypothetical protein